LETLLGSPFTCPHGYPIPDREGHVDDPAPLRTLAELRAGQGGRVARVDEHVPGLLAHLQGLGIVPGAKLQVVATNPVDATVVLRADGEPGGTHVVGPRIARAVSVTVAPRESAAAEGVLS